MQAPTLRVTLFRAAPSISASDAPAVLFCSGHREVQFAEAGGRSRGFNFEKSRLLFEHDKTLRERIGRTLQPLFQV